jgi:predicted phosphodiesterase
MMRVAVFSDVHGNLTALEAVLKGISRRAVDAVVFAGDLCLVGPRPAACVQKLKDAEIISIYGNTDDWVLDRQGIPDRLAALGRWTAAQLSEGERNWLNELPFAHRFSPTDRVQDDLLVVHANPKDVNQIIFPSEVEQQVRYGIVRQRDEDLEPLLGDVRAGIVAFGHLHIPSERNWKKVRLVNISSVSMPGDGDPQAKFGLFTWEKDAWRYERFAVSYNITPEIEAYKRRQPPGWENIVATMEAEGCFPQRV